MSYKRQLDFRPFKKNIITDLSSRRVHRRPLIPNLRTLILTASIHLNLVIVGRLVK